ncbi:MAG: alpha/beta fold hydrolase [Gemmobacter sp.]
MASAPNALTTTDGRRYRRAGAGPPLVLVHGFLGGSEQWLPEIACLAPHFDVIAPDLPGFGAACGAAGCARIEDMADSLIALLDGLGIREFCLLGHSMGGMIVQDIARKVPDRVTRLVLFATGARGLMPDRFEPIETSKQRLNHDGITSTAARIVATWFVDGTDATGFASLAAIGAGANSAAALCALDAMAVWDGRAHLAALTMPTLVIWGEKDRSYRWPQIELLWKALPNAGLAVIPRAAHAAHLEKPAVFHALLSDFFSLSGHAGSL